MHLRRRWAWAWFGLASAAFLSACAPSDGPRGPERDQPTPPASAAMRGDAPSPGALPAQAGRRAQARAPDRTEPVVHHGTGVFIDPDAAARRQVAKEEEGEFTLNFAGADVREVVRTVLGETLGLNYAVDPAVQGSITMQTSQPLPRSAVLPALESVLELSGATILEEGDMYRVVPLEGAMLSTATPLIGLSIDVPVNGSGARIVPLRHISANEMRRILEPFVPSGAVLEVDAARNLLILAAAGQQMETLLTLVDIFDVDFLKGRSFALVPLNFAAAERVQGELEAIFASDQDGPLEGLIRFVPIERLNGILVISARPEYIDQARVWIERLDQGAGSGERRLYVYPVQNGRAFDLASLLSGLFGTETEQRDPLEPFPPGMTTTRIGTMATSAPSLGTPQAIGGGQDSRSDQASIDQDVAAAGAPAGASSPAPIEARPGGSGPSAPALIKGELRIIADEANNALVILATPKEFGTVQEALRQLDIVPLEVLIEATIAEVTLNEQLRYGLQWFFKFGTNSFTLADSGVPVSQFPGFSYLATSGADIRVVLNALDAVTDLNVVSSPQLVVLNNQVATLQVGDQVPVVTAQAVNVATDQTLINTIQFVDTGVILRVRPRVNASGLVTLELEQEVSDPIGGGLTPTINQRRIQSTVAVQDGETITLGGLIRDRRSRSERGVPGLSSIPIVGSAFSTTDRTDTRTELLVLITPRVIRNLAEARRVTDELRQRVRALEPLDERIR